MGVYLEAAKKIRAVMDKAAGMLTDEQAAQVTALFPGWDAAVTYAAGDRVRYGGVLYKCLTAHTAQEGWKPADAPGLWAKVLTDPSGEILPWEQPGSDNGYAKGDKVTHDGKIWESLVDNNVWEPGATGTESLWKEVAA